MSQSTVTLTDGRRIPLLGFGTWQLRGRSAYESVTTALEVGYRHLDTATRYRNETQIGAALADCGIPREEIFVATKLPPDEAGNERRTLERSLEALRTDYVDLWLVHWPPKGAGIPTWKAFAELAGEGLARSIGVSNYSPAQIDELIDATGVTPAVNQIKWSPFLFDRDRLEHSRARGVVLEGYSPLRAAKLDHPVLEEIAQAHGKSPTQVILRWHLEHEVVVIPKSARRQRIEANFDVFDFALRNEEVAAVDALS